MHTRATTVDLKSDAEMVRHMLDVDEISFELQSGCGVDTIERIRTMKKVCEILLNDKSSAAASPRSRS